jgi:DNA-binding response OmpR family regulator
MVYWARPKEVLTRDDLLNAAWGVDCFGRKRPLDQHIAQRHKKIGTNPASPQFLLMVHGAGYKYQP